MKKLSYVAAFIGIVIGVFASVRAGAIVIALATALFIAPDFKELKAIQRLIPIALVVSLITVALALPRR